MLPRHLHSHPPPPHLCTIHTFIHLLHCVPDLGSRHITATWPQPPRLIHFTGNHTPVVPPSPQPPSGPLSIRYTYPCFHLSWLEMQHFRNP